VFPRRCAILLCGAWLLACQGEEEGLCQSLAGDATCSERYGWERPYCSTCTAEHGGCLPEPPPPVCTVEGPAFEPEAPERIPQATDATSSADESSHDVSGGGTTSTETSEASDIDGSSGEPLHGCNAPEQACGEGSVCHAAWGECLPCLADTDCERGSCSGHYTCESTCTEHRHCPASACDMLSGACLDDGPVLHVASCDATTGSGTPDDPYCSVQAAIDAGIPAGMDGTIVLADSDLPYDGFAIAEDRRVAVLGRGNRVTSDGMFEAIYVRDGALYLQGVTVEETYDAALKCLDGGSVFVDDTLFTDNEGSAIRADACRTAMIRRSMMTSNRGHAIEAMRGSQLELVASMVACNGLPDAASPAVVLENASLTIRASTLASNASLESASNLRCSGGRVQIVDSVLVAPSLASVDCPGASWQDSVVDHEDADGTGMLHVHTWSRTWFESTCDLHLRPGMEHPFAGVATWDLGDPRFDVDDTWMSPTPAQVIYAGADQL